MMVCSFGEVNRNMIENLSEEFKEFRVELKKEFYELRETNRKLYNHLSSRLPWWATTLFTIMAGALGYLIKLQIS